VSGAGRKAEVAVDLVHDSDIELGELGGRGDGGEKRSGGVTGSDVVGGNSGLISSNVVSQVSSDVDSGSDRETSGGGKLRHVEDIDGSGGGHASGGVFNSEVGSLVSLECHFASRAWDEGSLQHI